LSVFSSIGNYFALHQAVATTLPPGSTVQKWTAELGVLRTEANKYKKDATTVVAALQALQANLSTDAASFKRTVSDLNATVNGDNGILERDDKQLADIQSKIDGAIAGIALGALGIIGGVFMIVVGTVADFVMAGTATPLVVGGIALIVAGISTDVGAGIALAGLNDQKAQLLTEESTLTTEVNLALGVSSSYQSLSNQVSAAVEAANAISKLGCRRLVENLTLPHRCAGYCHCHQVLNFASQG
jgi:non-hemolytic enterotoxin B/C